VQRRMRPAMVVLALPGGRQHLRLAQLGDDLFEGVCLAFDLEPRLPAAVTPLPAGRLS